MATATENGKIVIRCPVCSYFCARLECSTVAELELNCPSTRCSTTIFVKKEGDQVSVTARPHAAKQ